MKLPTSFYRVNECMWPGCKKLAAYINYKERAYLCREHMGEIAAYRQVASVHPDDLSPIARDVQTKRIAMLEQVFPDDRPITVQDLVKKEPL